MPSIRDRTSSWKNGTPPLNIDVVSAICSHLPLSDIKNCRLVSKMWDEGAKITLKNESTTRLNFSLHPDDIQKNARFSQEMSTFGSIINMNIVFRHDPRTCEYNKFNKVKSVSSFASKLLAVPNLKISGTIRETWQDAILQKILLKGINILVRVELDLCYIALPNLGRKTASSPDTLVKPGFCEGRKFHGVKKLTFYISDFLWPAMDEKLYDMVTAFPQVEDMSVNKYKLSTLWKGDKSPFPSSVRKLTVLHLTSEYNLPSLLQMTQPLTSLSLNLIKPSTPQNEEIQIDTAVRDLLSKHAPTLEHLTLGLSHLRSKTAWKLPLLPKVKRLQLYVPARRNDFEVEFDSGKEDEKSNVFLALPQMRELTLVFMGNWRGEWLSCMESLFPSDKGVVGLGGVTQFEIRDQWESSEVSRPARIFEKGEAIDGRYIQILKIFPHVDNKFMESLRMYYLGKPNAKLGSDTTTPSFSEGCRLWVKPLVMKGKIW